MTVLSVLPPYPIFFDSNGAALENGYVHIGAAGLDPVTNPINVYWDAALSIPATQPIRTKGGYYSNSGTPAMVYANSDHSIRVTNSKGSLVYSSANRTERFSSVVVVGIDSSNVSFTPAGAGAVATTAQSKLRESPSVMDFLDPNDVDGTTDNAAGIRAALAEYAGKTIKVPEGTYALKTTSGGAYLTLSSYGTTLDFDRNAKFLFDDAATIGINITAQSCKVRNGMLWGTNTSTPTLTAINVTGAYAVIQNNNIAYSAIGTAVPGSYVIKHVENTYAGCDRYLYTSGSCADIESFKNTYGTTSIGSNPAVEIAGSGGADLHDYWELQGTSKLSLKCTSGAQRVLVRGKFFDSGGIEVGSNVNARIDAEIVDSYTSNICVNIVSGGSADLTGSYINGNGITGGVEAINADGTLIMGSGNISDFQTAMDINAAVSVGDVLISQCTTGVDIATAASGKVGPLTFSGCTTNIVRTTSSTVSLPDAWSGSATYNPPSLVDGDGATTSVTATGARLGDFASASFSLDMQGIQLDAWVSAADTVSVRFQNETGGTIDLGSGTLRVKVSGKTI